MDSDQGSPPPAQSSSAVRVVTLPRALDHLEAILAQFEGRQPMFFLDFDGTLSPIVDHPEDAAIDPATREAVRRLAERYPIGILSGRDREDVERRVGLDGLVYAGSHGFDVLGPDGLRYEHEEAADYLPELDALEDELRAAVAGIDGALVDRKRFAVAVHDRQVADALRPRVQRAAAAASMQHPRLHTSKGRRVHEFRPDVPWDKGRALLWLIDALGYERAGVAAIYVGDDTTDEDAFLALRGTEAGVAVVVRSDDRETGAQYRLDGTEEVLDLLVRLRARLAAT